MTVMVSVWATAGDFCRMKNSPYFAFFIPLVTLPKIML